MNVNKRIKRIKRIHTGDGYMNANILGDNVLLYTDNDTDNDTDKLQIILPDVSKYSVNVNIKYLENTMFTNFMDIMSKINNCIYYYSTCDNDYFVHVNFHDLTYTYTLLLYNNIKTCLKTYNRVFIPISVTYSTGSHSNLIIVDNLEKKIYYFEPHGSKFTSNIITNIIDVKSNIIKIIKKIFIEINDYVDENVYDNIRCGVQTRQIKSSQYSSEGGFCLSWTLLVIHLSLLNMTIPIKKIVKWLNNRSGYQLDIYIKKYTNYVYSSNIYCITKGHNSKLIVRNIELSNIENMKINNIIYEYINENTKYQQYIYLFLFFNDFYIRYMNILNTL